MRWLTENYVILTHIPTGLSARSNCCYNRRTLNVNVRLHIAAKALLRAKLAKLREDPTWHDGYHPDKPLVRSYHLHPPFGIAPFARDTKAGTEHPIGLGSFGMEASQFLDRVMLASRRAERDVVAQPLLLDPSTP
jgi:hypothetical protein